MRVNPMVWLHFQLAAGWRNLIVIGGLYIAGFFVGTTLFYRLSGPGMTFPGVAAGALGFVTASQGVFLLMLGSGAIHESIQRDFASGMMESHRITPMSGARIVLGYLGGGYVQAGILYAASLLMGTFYASQTALPLAVSGWWMSQICILCVALMFASLGLAISLVSRGKVNIIVIVVMVSVFGGWAIVGIVPGIGLLGGAMTAAVFWAMFRGTPPAGGDALIGVITLAVQLCLAGTLLTAAFRKVRAPERPLFPLPLAFLLLLVCGATLALGVNFQDVLDRLRILSGMDDLGAKQIVCSTIAFLVLAQLALVSAAFEMFYLDRARAFGEPPRLRRRWALIGVPALLSAASVALIELMLVLLADQGVRVHYPTLHAVMSDWKRHAAIGLALLASFWIDFNLVYAGAVLGIRALRLLVASAIVLKLLPLLLDAAIMFLGEMSEEQVKFVDGYFAGGSPIGTLILATTRGGNPWPGLTFQAALAITAGLACTRFRRRLGRRPASLAPPMPPMAETA